MKRLTAVLVAMGFSAAAFAHEPGELTQMWEQSYDRIAAGEALPPEESAYGYGLSDPYVVPSDTVVLIPLDGDEVPG